MALRTASGSPRHTAALPRALGQESQGQCQDQAPGWRQCWARVTQPPTYYRHPRTARLMARREGVGTHTTGTCGGLAPGLAREAHAHTGARLRKGAPPWLTSLPTARHGKAWLIQGTAGLFGLTQFHQTTQWKTDSERIASVSS